VVLRFADAVDLRAVAGKVEITDDSAHVVLWRDPGDISKRDLFYGEGRIAQLRAASF